MANVEQFGALEFEMIFAICTSPESTSSQHDSPLAAVAEGQYICSWEKSVTAPKPER